VVTKKEVQEADYNLSPSQFVEVNDKVTHRPISEILMDLEIARSEREKADKDLAEVLAKLKIQG
jgi:type I restriction enzyme M protein